MEKNSGNQLSYKKMGVGIAIGLAIGISTGVALGDFVLGVAIGTPIGVSLGIAMTEQDRRANKNSDEGEGENV